jgi:hypothetical protein
MAGNRPGVRPHGLHSTAIQTVMSKDDNKLEQKSPAKHVSIVKDGEPSDEQFNEVSGGSSPGG